VFDDGDFGGASTATNDQIHDFSSSDNDRIRLDFVDANTSNGTATNDSFAFIGTSAFHGTAGELRYQLINGNTFVQGDLDGDGVADFFIRSTPSTATTSCCDAAGGRA